MNTMSEAATNEQTVNEAPAPLDNNIYRVLERSKYPTSTLNGYLFNPIVGKEAIWQPLGDKLSANERTSSACSTISQDSYYTLRLDGKGFSKVLPRLRSLGFLEPNGYSQMFGEIMQETALAVATKTFPNALYVFTQSDEITVVFDKARRDKNGDLMPMPLSGRVFKYLTHAASTATFTFTKCLLAKLVLRSTTAMVSSSDVDGSPDCEISQSERVAKLMMELPEIVFDARLGLYSTLEDAFELVLWRSYDCAVNGVSSGVYFLQNVPDKKKAMLLDTSGKLKFLSENGFLPLPNHQMYGSFYQLTTVEREVVNRQTGETFKKFSQAFQLVPGPVLRNFKDGKIVLQKTTTVDAVMS